VCRGEDGRSQESDDVLGRPQAGGGRIGAAGSGREGTGRGRRRSGSSPILDENLIASAREVDVPLAPAADLGVRGRAFKEKVRRLLSDGITEPSTRHDAVLTLSFYWAATCGLGEVGALARLEAWCKAHAHAGSRLAARGRVFRETCAREARHYIVHHAARWRFRGRGDGGGLATLTSADQAVLAAIDPQVRGEVSAILAWLAGRADGDGRLGEPVQIATGLLARLCGDRRIVDDEGKRRRATTCALAELERLGVLTLSSNYRVGQRGRVWSCWYKFGSGELPRAVEMSAAAWAAMEPPPSAVAVAPALAIAAPPETRLDAPGAPIVVVRVVGERAVPEGLVRVLSDGTRGVPRTLLALAPEVARPTAVPSVRAPWFVRPFQARTFTPAELWAVSAATVIPFPDVAARRRMSRRERLAWGGGTGEPSPVIPIARRAGPGEASVRAAEGPPVTPVTPVTPAPAAAVYPAPPEPRAVLVAEVGDAADALPLELVDVVAQAWRAFRRGRDP